MPGSLKLLHVEESQERVATAVRALEQAGFSVDCRRVRSDLDLRAADDPDLLAAERIDAASRLAGIVAHDINNLLTVIKGYAGLVLDMLPDDEPIRRDVAAIDDAASGAEQLTRQLLTFSRRQPAEPESLCLNEPLRGMLRALEQMAGTDVAVVSDLADDLWPVWIDRGHLQQIVTNLAANAREAMPWGGRLIIATRNSPATERPAAGAGDDCVILSVSDTGRGMSEEVCRQIFEPFFTTKRSGRGAGLGLPTVYGMVKQANGSVRVSSEPARGTTFEVLLPRQRG